MGQILIIGWPRAGKSTLGAQIAKNTGAKHLCTDPQHLCPPGVEGLPNNLDWSEGSQYVSNHWIGKPNTIVEGLGVVRAIRKWMDQNPGKRLPVDKIIHLQYQDDDLNPRQAGAGKGHDKVLDDIYPSISHLIEER